MKRLRRLICCLIAVMCLSTGALELHGASWELVEQYRGDGGDDERIEIEVHEHHIYVSTPKAVTVKIYTILGQPVSQETIPAGVSRMKLAQRGVYILKIGSITRRVNI